MHDNEASNTRITRRTALHRLLGTAIGVGTATSVGTVGSVTATPPGKGNTDDELRLFSELAVDNAQEVVTQQNHAYVATGPKGMAIVDWHNPGGPEVVAEVDLGVDLAANGLLDDDMDVSVLDVKVDGDIAALANDDETIVGGTPGGIALYDVSDPTDPEFQSFYTAQAAGPLDSEANIHNCFLDDTHAYLVVDEPLNIDTDDDDERDLVRLSGVTGVEIVDISDPAVPSQAATWMLDEEFPTFANSGIGGLHDCYVQDGHFYGAFWDAGTVVLDVSTPSNPAFVTQFGDAPAANTEVRPWRVNEESFGFYLFNVYPLFEFLAPPGNAHYVQPSPDGTHVYVGAETFADAPGAIDVWNVSDPDNPMQVATIDPPDVDAFRTAHNFDVTANRLYASWYNGGVRVYDITDPSTPEELAAYDPDGYSFWTAVRGRGFTLGGVYGARSDASAGGIVVLHDDRGTKQPPEFDGTDSPNRPEHDPRETGGR